MLEYHEHGAEWDWVQFDVDGARDAILRATTRVAARLRATTQPSLKADGLDWTISETAVHLVVVARANASYAQGATEPVLELDRLDETNRARIDELPERDLDVLAGLLEASVDELLRSTADLSASSIVPWHSRTELPLGGMFGIVLAELLLHGRDIAQALRERWTIEADDARHVVRGGFAFGPLVINRDLARTRPVTYRVRCPGVPTSTWRFVDGTLTVSPDGDGPVDCHLRLDPVTFTLVAFGRQTPISAALRGRALTWGRRPLAALRVPSYFVP